MSELDLLNLARSDTANEVAFFAQVITINFAMVVAIYYFLSQARLAMKLFAFAAYGVGMLLYLGQMLIETNLKYAVLASLKALPRPSAVTQEYLGLNDSWLGHANVVLFNGAFWILGLGIFYLLFFWKKREPS
ncbi:MAG TPA: hypothetical protein VN932_05620 [Rhizomicrobium sp.]|nr:hypothetical protein [Rhizomicrobium sp.]